MSDSKGRMAARINELERERDEARRQLWEVARLIAEEDPPAWPLGPHEDAPSWFKTWMAL